MTEVCNDYVSDIIDEIALEGLDGITLEALWLRLSERPGFIFKPIDDHLKLFLWKIIRKLTNVSFYNLPIPRGNLFIFKRAEHIDAVGNFYEPESLPPCIYPHCPIEDDGIMGSCSTYNTRQDITSTIRTEDYKTAESRGNSLVVVANQVARSKAIFSTEFNPVTEIGVVQYCILERIARSRYEGEVTQGKRGLQVVTDDPKMLYYFRKLLVKNKLVQKQVFYMRVSKQTATGSLIHLPRFFSEIKTKQDIDALKLIKYLEKTPLKCIPFKCIKQELNIEVKKLLMKYPKNFKSIQLPYRTLHPNSKPSEWKLKSTGEEKSVRVLKLLSCDISKEEEEEDDDEEEIGLMDESRRRMDRSLMRQAYSLVEQAGPRGIKQGSLGCLLAVPSLQARSICKHLVKKKLVRTVLIDVGRQRISHFYCTKFDSAESSLRTEMKEERNKLLHAISVNTELCDEKLNIKTEIPLEIPYEESSKEEKPNVDSMNQNSIEESEVEEKFKSEPQDGIEAEIIISKPEILNDKISRSLTEIDKGDSPIVTARMLKRASLIVQAVNLHRVLQDTQKVQRIISEVEESEGLKQTIDRKTIQRLLDNLESDGLLRTIRVNLKGYGKEKSMVFICHPSVTESHSEIQSAIEQAKMKLPIVSAHHSKKKRSQEIVKKPKLATLKYEPKAGRKYGYKPKFIRMQILHTYMFYLIYGYEGDVNLDQSCKQEMIEKNKCDASLEEEMSFVYRTEVDWKMFLPPLPVHSEYTEGWCLLSDVLLRLPLCLFVSIVNVPYNIPELLSYLEHPIKRYFLVKHMPPEILHHLTIMRKYIFVISDVVSRLGFIGLIQMGPQKLKEKDQVFIYLNRHALLYNTIPSDVGYNHISKNKDYECIQYHFYSIEDVEHYWYDLWNFAMNTNLGNRNSMTGKPVVVESVNTKLELLAAVQPKVMEEAKACDVGYIPGDGLGAGGLDSDMFLHLKRNWYWTGEKAENSSDPKSILCPPALKERSKLRSQEENISSRIVVKDPQSVKVPKVKEKEATKHLSDISKSKLSKVGAWKSRAVSKKKTRILRQRKTKFTRKPYYDQKDRDALSKMVKLRVDWSPTEDNLLLICKVASLYMSPNKRRQVVKNFCAVRDVLHLTYPAISKNKTSRACQRRMHYMMKNASTAQSVYLCLEEIKQDPEINEKFHDAVDRLDALLKAQGEGPRGYQQEYDDIFMNLVSTLLKKLKTVTNNENTSKEISLPSTVAEFEKKYKIIIPAAHTLRNGTFNEVQKTVDILAAVINTVIHSSLCGKHDRTSYSHQLFYIYQQYPDKLLRYVMAKCRSMSIVSCRKRYKRWKTAANDCLPLASSPYQLSITYVHILQTKYQYCIYSECYDGLKFILSNTSPKSLPVIDNEGLENQSERVSMQIEVNTGGECANIVELFSAGLIEMNVEFPEQLIVLDPRISETEESYQLIMKRFKEILAVINDARKKENKTILSEDEEDDDDFVVDKSQGEIQDNYLDQFNLKNKTGVANTASRLALYLMRDEPLEQLDKSLQHAHDFFVLNPCKVTVDLLKNKAEETIFYEETKSNLINRIKRFAMFPGDVKENASVAEELEEFPETLTLALLDYLESKGELGATYADLMVNSLIDERFDDSQEFKNLVMTLIDEQIILRTGVVSVRFIHSRFTKLWLVKSFHLLRLTRDSMDTPTVNYSYAISFNDNDSSLKRTSNDDNTSENSLKDSDIISPQRKKLKTHDITSNKELHESSPESIEDSHVPCKKARFDYETKESTTECEQSSEALDCNKSMPVDKEVHEVLDEEKNPENDQSRYIMKITTGGCFRVANENSKKFTNFDTVERIYVLVKVRPWIKIDGNLNRRVLDRLLGSVLGHCLTYPGLSVKSLQDRFIPALQPVHTFELLEMLVQIKCVKLINIKKSWKCTLFSKRVEISTGPASCLDNSSDMVVDPDPLAVSRLGYFIGDKTYNVDYLEALSQSDTNIP